MSILREECKARNGTQKTFEGEDEGEVWVCTGGKEGKETTPTGFEQPQATPVIPHIIENYKEWPSNLSAFTEPLFKSIQNPANDPGSSSADRYPLAFKEAMSTHKRLLKVLSNDALHPELGPDPKTTIIGPLAGGVLQHVFPHAELHFDVHYPRAIYPCCLGETSSRLLPTMGNAVSLVCVPLSNRDPKATSSTPISSDEGDSSDDSSTDADLPPRNRLLENFHLLVRSDTNHHHFLSFPLIYVASYTEMYSLLVSALLHRRVVGELSPIIGLAFHPMECRVQVVYAWLQIATSHSCLEVHTAHAPLSKGLEDSCGVFDLSVSSSILSFTAYLLEIAPLCLPSFQTSLQDLNDLKNILPIWRLDSLPPEREDPEELLHKWIAEHTSQVLHQSPLKLVDSRKRSSETDNSYDSTCSHTRDMDTSDFFSSSSGLSAESQIARIQKQLRGHSDVDIDFCKLNMIMKSCSEEGEQAELDIATQVLADRFTRYIFWPVTPFALINTAPLQKLQVILQRYVEVGAPMIELPPAYRTRERLEEITLGLNSAAGDEIYTLELAERYCDILFELTVEQQLRVCIGMTPLRTLVEGELSMFLKCIPGILHVSEQAAHSKIESRLPWDSLLDLVFGSCGKEAIIRRDRRIHLSRNHSCDFSQSAGYRLWMMDCVSSSFWESMKLEEPTLKPSTTPSLKSMPTLVQSQGSEARRKYLTLMRNTVFDRNCTIDIAMGPWSDKATREEILSRAITSDFTYAVSDALVAARPDMLVPKTFAAEYGFFLSGDVIDSTDSSTAAAVSTKSQDETDFSIFRSLCDDVKSLTKSIILEQNETSRTDSDAAILPPTGNPDAVRPLKPATGSMPSDDKSQNGLASPLLLPFLFMEYKKGASNILAGMNQARFYLVSACRYLASLGIFDFPVFAVATQGFKGRLLCAWSTPPDSEDHKSDGGISAMYDGVYIADTNCPEWDITDPGQAVKFALFLTSLKSNYVPELLKRFKEVEADIEAELAKMDDKVAGAGERFKWAMTHQRKEGVLKSVVDLLAESDKVERKSKKRRIDSELEVPLPP